jgi:hypothetical protein
VACPQQVVATLQQVQSLVLSLEVSATSRVAS